MKQSRGIVMKSNQIEISLPCNVLSAMLEIYLAAHYQRDDSSLFFPGE
jgi:hypothetical protein